MINRLAHLGRQACLCAAASLSLCAESPRLGVEALGSWPTGSMRGETTDRAGGGLGVFADWEVDAGRTIRLAYQGLVYSGALDRDPLPGIDQANMTSLENNRKSRSNALTLQYLYFPQQDNEGFYLMAGLGAMKYNTRNEATLLLANGAIQNLTLQEDTGTRLACVAGVGYAFDNNWGVSANYSFITVNNRTLGSAQAGVSYRF